MDRRQRRLPTRWLRYSLETGIAVKRWNEKPGWFVLGFVIPKIEEEIRASKGQWSKQRKRQPWTPQGLDCQEAEE